MATEYYNAVSVVSATNNHTSDASAYGFLLVICAVCC